MSINIEENRKTTALRMMDSYLRHLKLQCKGREREAFMVMIANRADNEGLMADLGISDEVQFKFVLMELVLAKILNSDKYFVSVTWRHEPYNPTKIQENARTRIFASFLRHLDFNKDDLQKAFEVTLSNRSLNRMFLADLGFDTSKDEEVQMEKGKLYLMELLLEEIIGDHKYEATVSYKH